jgi:hypothetical protein
MEFSIRVICPRNLANMSPCENEGIHEHGKSSLHSENLYQMFSYLKNAEALGGPYRYAEGILLYPTVGDPIAFGADIQGHHVRVCTVNLDQPWQIIRSDLLAVIGLPDLCAGTNCRIIRSTLGRSGFITSKTRTHVSHRGSNA